MPLLQAALVIPLPLVGCRKHTVFPVHTQHLRVSGAPPEADEAMGRCGLFAQPMSQGSLEEEVRR